MKMDELSDADLSEAAGGYTKANAHGHWIC
jgi:hypothetical protein